MNKLLFLLKKPKVIVVLGKSKETAKEAILAVLRRHPQVGKKIVVLDGSSKDLKFFLKKSELPILVATHVGEYHPEKEFFDGELKDTKEIERAAGFLPPHSHLVLNFDDETVRDIKNKSNEHSITFGFGARADIRASDIVLTQFPDLGTNFKINYEGNIVPCWLENLLGKENIYAALAAMAVGEILGLNLVRVSEALKSYKGVAGKMRLIKGIKGSSILDDSESASSLSMLESLETLKKLEIMGRKIAVLGDIMGIGKYAIEAHEALGENISGSSDLLYTVGERAKFFAQGAKIKGMAEDKIFQFADAKEAGLALQLEIKEGDLVLVDGSKEMEMKSIVDEIRFL